MFYSWFGAFSENEIPTVNTFYGVSTYIEEMLTELKRFILQTHYFLKLLGYMSYLIEG